MNDIYSIKDFNMPEGFLWGSATAGHQIEGDNVNSSCYHEELEKVKTKKGFEHSGKACNSYEMWPEDIELLSTLKHQAFRMTIEWSRIEPAEGEFKSEEMDHYLQILEALKERNIKIVLTIVHGTVPQWFALKGAFTNMDNLKYFERYLEYLVPKVSQYIDYWCIFNEFNSEPYSSAFPHKIGSIRFHARGNSIIKKYSSSPVSSSHAFRYLAPRRERDPFDTAIANYMDVMVNEFWLHAIRTGEIVLPETEVFYDPEIKDSCDYWAVNSYYRWVIDSRKRNPRSGGVLNYNKVLFEDDLPCFCDPDSLFQSLLRLKDKPVLITENGIYGRDDRYRIVWILEYLSAVKTAIDFGVDVKGYLHWSLLDNYEWGTYDLKFGLVDVDFENNFKRTIKPSAYFYKDIIENNGYKKEMLEKYLKATPDCRNREVFSVHYRPDTV